MTFCFLLMEKLFAFCLLIRRLILYVFCFCILNDSVILEGLQTPTKKSKKLLGTNINLARIGCNT